VLTFDLARARAKLSMRPLISHCLNADGIDTVRLTSILEDQKSSLRWTAVKGTGRG